jgi:hypothetical protein
MRCLQGTGLKERLSGREKDHLSRWRHYPRASQAGATRKEQSLRYSGGSARERVLVVYFTSIRPAKIGEDEITLAGVSSEFVGKLKEYRQSHPRERKGTRRANRRRRGEHEG